METKKPTFEELKEKAKLKYRVTMKDTIIGKSIERSGEKGFVFESESELTN